LFPRLWKKDFFCGDRQTIWLKARNRPARIGAYFQLRDYRRGLLRGAADNRETASPFSGPELLRPPALQRRCRTVYSEPLRNWIRRPLMRSGPSMQQNLASASQPPACIKCACRGVWRFGFFCSVSQLTLAQNFRAVSETPRLPITEKRSGSARSLGSRSTLQRSEDGDGGHDPPASSSFL